MCSIASKIGPVIFLMATLIASTASGEPEVSIEGPQSGVYPGVTQEIRYDIRWAESESYVIDAPTWANEEGYSISRTEVGVDQDGQAYYRFIMKVTPRELGEFIIPTTNIHYTIANKPATGDGIAQLVVTAPAYTLTVRQDRTSQYIAGGILAVALILILTIAISLRKQRKTPEVENDPPQVRYQRGLHVARQKRLDGDLYGYYQALATLARELDKGLHQTLAAKVQAVGFGGMRPSDDELDGDLRAIERAVTRWKEEE